MTLGSAVVGVTSLIASVTNSAPGAAIRSAAAAEGSALELSYCTMPVVVGAAIRDIHESSLNGPQGYAYFAAAKKPKRGRVPATVGYGPTERFDTCAHASNFRGPEPVGRSPRQWEWSAAGSLQTSSARYPLIYAAGCASSPGRLGEAVLPVYEHDDGVLIDDTVGAVVVDRSACERVFASGATSGWATLPRAPGRSWDGVDDIAYVDVRLWCYRCASGGDCRYGVGESRQLCSE